MNNLNAKQKLTGVYYNVSEKSYSAWIRVNKKWYCLGCNPDKLEAICTRKSAENVIKNVDCADMSVIRVWQLLTGIL